MLERVTAYKCAECDHIGEDFEDEPLYECSCGNIFTRSDSADGDSHRCPNDSYFSQKIADNACSSCRQAGVEEIEALKCSDCGELVDPKEVKGEECPCCKEREMKKQELDRIKELPVDQRGGQKTFATKEQAQEAFKKFIGAVKSDVVRLVPSKDYDTSPTREGGVVWNEFPKPYVSFSFEVVFVLPPDKYIKEYSSQPGMLSDLFFKDVDEATKKYLKGETHWNNTCSHGSVWVKE